MVDLAFIRAGGIVWPDGPNTPGYIVTQERHFE